MRARMERVSECGEHPAEAGRTGTDAHGSLGGEGTARAEQRVSGIPKISAADPLIEVVPRR
jgi:hypothetical protein